MSLKPKKIDFDITWGGLKDTVHGVITLGDICKSTWNDRFTDVYAICVAYPEPQGERLYQETKEYLEQHVKMLYKSVSENEEENLLTVYHRNWEEYSRGADYLNKLYMYLNMQFVKKQKFSEADFNYGGMGIDMQEQMLEVGELALNLWKEHMIEPLRENLVTLILKTIESDRLGEAPNQNIVKGVILSFVDVEHYKKSNPVELYESIFEVPFLKGSGEYYRKEASELLRTHDCSAYMKKVIQRLDDENMRSHKFLHPSSYTKVMHECEQRMIADHLQVLYGECHRMVNQESKDDLQNMYKLLKPVQDGLVVLIKEVQEHVKSEGLEAISNLKGDTMPSQFVENLLQVHKKYLELIHGVFMGDQQFLGALDKACAAVINTKQNPKQPCRSAELLAKYCDTLLKKSAKGVTETEVDDKLGQSIIIFRYIDDKDVFQKFYSRMLAKRLIYSQSTSMDAEEGMINRLKQACGYEFTNKLHRMFTDISVSNDLNNKFSTFLKKDNLDLGINFTIFVLQAGAWPLGQANLSQFSIPERLVKSVQLFEKFYNTNFNGRKLTWVHHLCQVELKVNYLKKTYFITMGTFQMAMLIMFEQTDSLTYKELQLGTQLNTEQFIRHLNSLVEAKLLTPTPEGPLSEDSVLTLNKEYGNKRTKFKIIAAVQKEAPQEVEQTHSAVDEDRKMYLQATIVRIMKARKVLRHNILVQEVISQSSSRFSPVISMIKKCIEALIDKQYLERTANSSDEYSYIA